MINITGGTVNAVTRSDSKPAIGTVDGNLDLTIDSSTGKTTVNTYTTSSDPLSLNIGTGHFDSSSWKYRTSPSEGAEYNEDGSSHLGEDNAAIINFYRNTPLGTGTYDAPKTLDDYAFHSTSEFQGTIYNAKYILSDKDKGDLYKVVHNRKYMDENPNIDTKKREDENFVLVFTVQNDAGSLAQTLNIIGAHGYNMRTLRSRPMKGLSWKYFFYVEAEGCINNTNGREMLQELSATCAKLRLVGAYYANNI